jgi:carboxyl-terminal processing protease
MPSRPQSLHRRQAFLWAALFLTLTFAAWADDPTNAAPPGAIMPATGGNTEQSTPKSTTAPVPPGATETPAPKEGTTHLEATKEDDAPVQLPEVKPVEIHADRDAAIGRKVGEILEGNHYLQIPISPEISQRWLKNYLDALDYNHLFFLQSDVDEFTAKYGNNLGDLLLNGKTEEESISPAFEIFSRYMQRLDENVVLAEKLLHEKYDFTKDETFTIRNHKSPWIADAAASEAIWRGQVKSDLLNGLLDKQAPDVTIKRLSKRYASLLREGTGEDDMDILEMYLCGLTHAYDPHSDYFQPDEAQNFNIQAIDHAVTGIGAVLRSDDGYATIEQIIAGGPADLDKRLKAGDKIIAVGQGNSEPVDAVNMKLNRVVDMIRGDKGSMVHLVVQPAGAADGAAHKDIILKRDMVSIKDSLAKAHIIEHPLPGGGTEKVGVIDLHDFYDNTKNHHSAVSDVSELIKRLKKENVAGIILDMRSNGGGLLDQAVDLTGLFVNHEYVVQIRRYDGYIDQLQPEETHKIYDGPLLVMVNKMSASATEIVAAALQDYGRAIIVGDQSTHGKGTVQTFIPLDQSMPIGFPSDPGPGSLKMTVQKFYRVAGGSTQQKGVVPDIVLPSVLDGLELGETTLPYYLPYDEVAPASYEYLNLTGPYLPDLKAASASRVAASPDFAYVRQDVAYWKKKVQDSTVSLNLAARLKEQDDLKKQSEARKKDLEARAASRDKMLDLTLDMVDENLPAAPPDVSKPKADAGADADPDADLDVDDAADNPSDDPQLDEAVKIMTDYTRALQASGSKLVQATTSAGK